MTTRRRPRRPRKPPVTKPYPPLLRHAEPERPEPGPGQTALPLTWHQPTLRSL